LELVNHQIKAILTGEIDMTSTDKRDREFLRSMFERPDDTKQPNPINWMLFCAEYLTGLLLLGIVFGVVFLAIKWVLG
jgi:hypothetical protein